jgi:hypothetical protein
MFEAMKSSGYVIKSHQYLETNIFVHHKMCQHQVLQDHKHIECLN